MTAELFPKHLPSVSISTSGVDAVTASLIRKAISPNTKRIYRSALNSFLQWNANDNPFTDRNVAQYLSHLYHARNLAPASIAIAFSAIKRLARQAGILTGWKYTTETLAGIRRAGKEQGRGQSQGLTYEDFITLLNSAPQPRKYARKQESTHRAKMRGSVDRVIIALLFMAECVARRSQTCAGAICSKQTTICF